MESEEMLQWLQMTQYLSDSHVKNRIVGQNDRGMRVTLQVGTLP
jgi:hypothetical protein